MKKLLGPLYDTLFAYIDVCELRLSVGLPIQVRLQSRTIRRREICTQPMLDNALAVATDYSVYTAVSRMVGGYLPYRGGVRIGLAGRYGVQGQALHSLTAVTGMVIRLPHAVAGCSESLPIERVLGHNLLVVAPPFGGKTTYLRDIATRLSAYCRVVAVDERDELSGDGHLPMGDCLVVAGAPKHLVLEGVVRALAPQYVVCDELSPDTDIAAVRRLSDSGVHVVATLHGNDIDTMDKPLPDLFDVRVLLSAIPTAGHVVKVRYA